MSGQLIVIEGLDGSGKATQTHLLAEALAQDGKRARQLSFPCYEQEWSAPVRLYLNGALGTRPEDVNCYAASVFFSVDRYASYKTSWQADYMAGTLLLADRYTTSNAIYQMAKLPQTEWDGYMDWLFDFEYNRMGLPVPDAVIYLDLPPVLSRRLLDNRYNGDAGRRDIHERDLDFQQAGREAALYCAARQGWHVIACGQGETTRPPQDIAAEVWTAVKEVMG